MTENGPIFTVGHSTHSIEEFIELLQQHAVTALADVRSSPFSRYNPQFNRDVLKRTLNEREIGYVFLGRELGARPKDPSCYEDGRVQYRRLASTMLFREGIERLTRGRKKFRIALMCAEKEPLNCHRTLLIAPTLVERGFEVIHILADGTLEPHNRTIARLLGPQQDLFRAESELVEEAKALQEARVAYVNENLAKKAEGDARDETLHYWVHKEESTTVF